jgi:hypothetical protein
MSDGPELPFDDDTGEPTLPADEGWLQDKNGRDYVPNPTGRGTLRRRGTESVAERVAMPAGSDRQSERARARETRRSMGRGRRRGKADPKPKGAKPPRTKPAVSDAELQQLLEGLLAAPAIYAAAPRPIGLECSFCAAHFATQAGPTSVQLVNLAADNPGLRRALITLHDSWTKITYGGIIAAYVAKPMLHHLAPEQVLDTVGGVIGVTARTPAQEAAHQHGTAGTPPQYARPAPHAEPDVPAGMVWHPPEEGRFDDGRPAPSAAE